MACIIMMNNFLIANGETMTRLMIIDSKNLYPYHDFLDDTRNLNDKLIKEYFHNILDDIPHEVMVTDGYKAYPEIIKEFDMIQQRCVISHDVQCRPKRIIPQ